jgi:hypothetical protein
MDLTRSIAVYSDRFLVCAASYLRNCSILETVTQESLYELTDIVHRQVHPLLEHIEHWIFPAFSVISQSGEKRGFEKPQF